MTSCLLIDGPSAAMKSTEFVDQLSDYTLLKKTLLYGIIIYRI